MSPAADIWASLPVPALLIDADDRILEINAAAEGFLNVSAKSVVGVPLWDHCSSMTWMWAVASARRCNAHCRLRRFRARRGR